MNELRLYEEPKAKLIINRRAIAAGLAALVATPAASKALERKLGALSNVPLEFDATAFSGQMRDGMFLPDYRKPMVRLVFSDGSTTLWHRYDCVTRGPKGCGQAKRPTETHAVAIETCAPDKNGMPRYTQLAIG